CPRYHRVPRRGQGHPPGQGGRSHGGFTMRAWLTRPRLAACVVAAGSFLLPACNDGHLNVLGYTSEPPYDCSIQTVYVPIPQNLTYRRGLEFDLKRAIDREIESKTPYRVSSNPDNADTE